MTKIRKKSFTGPGKPGTWQLELQYSNATMFNNFSSND